MTEFSTVAIQEAVEKGPPSADKERSCDVESQEPQRQETVGYNNPSH